MSKKTQNLGKVIGIKRGPNILVTTLVWECTGCNSTNEKKIIDLSSPPEILVCPCCHTVRKLVYKEKL